VIQGLVILNSDNMELHWAENCAGDGGTVPEGISEFDQISQL
jgi:hypothetical protein